MKYRKKPVVVEAFQLTENIVAGYAFDDKPLPKGVRLGSLDTYPPSRRINSASFWVTTIHGQPTSVVMGDWIILEPDGRHFYPCEPDIFEATYELAEKE